MNKVAIIVGHTRLRQGACSPYDICCEWKFNKELAEELDDVADIYFHNSYNFGYKHMCKQTANKINKKDYNLVIELHYNAASPSANGCEALYYFKNKKSKELCNKFCELYTKNIGGKNRGAKALVNKYQRGFWAVYYPYAPTIILEPFFGTNKEDVDRVMESFGYGYSQVIRELIKESKKILE